MRNAVGTTTFDGGDTIDVLREEVGVFGEGIVGRRVARVGFVNNDGIDSRYGKT